MSSVNVIKLPDISFKSPEKVSLRFGDMFTLIILVLGILFIASFTKNLRLGLILITGVLMVAIIQGAIDMTPLVFIIVAILVLTIIFWNDLIKIPSFGEIVQKIENFFSFDLELPEIGKKQLTLIPPNDPKYTGLIEQANKILYTQYADPKKNEYYIVGSNLTNQIVDAFDPDYRKQLVGAKSFHIDVYPKPQAYYIINKPLSYAELGTLLVNRNVYIQTIQLPDGTLIGIQLPAQLKEGYVPDNEYHQSKPWEWLKETEIQWWNDILGALNLM